MTCHDVQIDLSLYLYGELDFAQEETIERHLTECAFCQSALAREKSWHSTLNSQQTDVPLTLLSQCRQELKKAVIGSPSLAKPPATWPGFFHSLGFSLSPGSGRLAFASFLLFAGFGAGLLFHRTGFSGSDTSSQPPVSLNASLLDPSTTRIREIQPVSGDQVRMLVEQVWAHEVVGSLEDRSIRERVLASTRDVNDPGLRVDSVEVLKDLTGSDVRDALLYAVQHDPNAGVRLKALEGLQRFIRDPGTREGLTFVLEHDEDPGVRSQAVDLLVPQRQPLPFNPELAGALQQAIQSRQNDDYVRMRCQQALTTMKTSSDVY